MGARGPKPLPKNVHLLRGNASKLPANRLTDAVEPEVAIPGVPKHLMPEARKFWKRIAPELAALGLVAKIDQAALALVCQEWGWLVYHESALQADIERAAAGRAEFEENEERLRAEAEARGEVYAPRTWTGGDGFQVATPNGSLAYSPHWVARNKHALLLDKFLASFGMSPSARGRVTASSRQLSLPGMDQPGAVAAGFDAM